MNMLRREDGLTVVELMVAIAISSFIFLILIRFMSQALPVSRQTYAQGRANDTARIQLKRITKIIREARQSDTGSYPLVEMSPQKIEFYSDIDADDTTELVRYELTGTNLVRGVTEPTGIPLVYDQAANEIETTIATSIQNGTEDIFTYYNGDYPADQTPLTPIDLTEVKYVQFRLLVDVDPQQEPEAIDIRSQVQLRNLKTNLGEMVN